MVWHDKPRQSVEQVPEQNVDDAVGSTGTTDRPAGGVTIQKEDGGIGRLDRRTALKLFGALSVGSLGTTGIGAAGGADHDEEDTVESPGCVETLAPEGAIETTGTWNLGTRAGDRVYVAGMRGIDPETNELVEGAKERVRQGFENMQFIAESAGASLADAGRIVVYVTDMYRYRPYVNEVQEEMWGDEDFPPRTIVEIDRLNQDDIFEVEGTFYDPKGESEQREVETLAPEGAFETTGTWSLGTRAGDVVYVAGMRGIDPETNDLVDGAKDRIRQGFENMQFIAESAGASLSDATRIVVHVTDMYRYRPFVNEVQEEMWGDEDFPPRTIVEVDRLNQDDIFEVTGTFYDPKGESEQQEVETLAPEGAFETTGTWSLGTRAGDLVYVAGMRGIDPDTNELVDGAKDRVRQGFENMQFIANSTGATLQDTTRIVVYVTDMYRYRPLVNEVQEEMWGDDPYPPRTIVEIDRLNQDDIFEVEGTFFAPENRKCPPERPETEAENNAS